jgi:hypothetical protein
LFKPVAKPEPLPWDFPSAGAAIMGSLDEIAGGRAAESPQPSEVDPKVRAAEGTPSPIAYLQSICMGAYIHVRTLNYIVLLSVGEIRPITAKMLQLS